MSSPFRPTFRLDHVLVRWLSRLRRHARPGQNKSSSISTRHLPRLAGSARQWANYEFCYLMLAGIATLLVITTCTVVSSDFSTSVIPAARTIFLPYFGVGAIYAASAC